MELLQSGRVLRPRGHKRGETAKMIIQIPIWQAVGCVLLSHTEGFHVTTLAVGVTYKDENATLVVGPLPTF